MKKINKDKKIYRTKHSSSSFEKRQKRHIRKKNLSKSQHRKKVFSKRETSFKKIDTPSDFSLVGNPEAIIKYFNDYRDIFKEGYSVLFNLSNIHNLTIDALALLLANMKSSAYTMTHRVRGNIPIKPYPQKLFLSSGFLNNVFSNIDSSQFIKGEMIENYSGKKIREDISAKVIKEICEHCLYSVNKDIHPTLIECMTNTQNHAGIGYNWRLTYFKDVNNVTKVCFLDLGEGIIKTINTKYNPDLREKISSAFGGNTSKILEALLKKKTDKIDKRTKTMLPQRGNGLPFMYEFTKNSYVKNFTIITNNAYANVSLDDYRSLKNHFKGTLIYWELLPIK